MQQTFLDGEVSDNVRLTQIGFLLREAFALDQLRDEILWQPDGTPRTLSKEEKELLADLKLVSTRLVAKIQNLRFGLE
jgi:hypothetical protein